MKAAVLETPHGIVERPLLLKDVPKPTVKPGYVLLRVRACGVCRTDLHVIEGLWRPRVSVKLPYIMGHENAGWVEAVGSGVDGVKKGDAVICHPLLSKGNTLAARRGNDMHAGGAFPGIDSNGGYAELLKTGERALIKLPRTLAPKDVAPHADAGLTAYHVAKKAARHLLPGEFVVVIGVGGLGHIAGDISAAQKQADGRADGETRGQRTHISARCRIGSQN